LHYSANIKCGIFRSKNNEIFEGAAAQLVSIKIIDNFIQLNVQGRGEEECI
jgi:hypothetical protein